MNLVKSGEQDLERRNQALLNEIFGTGVGPTQVVV
jgi:hypothetical protein